MIQEPMPRPMSHTRERGEITFERLMKSQKYRGAFAAFTTLLAFAVIQRHNYERAQDSIL